MTRLNVPPSSVVFAPDGSTLQRHELRPQPHRTVRRSMGTTSATYRSTTATRPIDSPRHDIGFTKKTPIAIARWGHLLRVAVTLGESDDPDYPPRWWEIELGGHTVQALGEHFQSGRADDLIGHLVMEAGPHARSIARLVLTRTSNHGSPRWQPENSPTLSTPRYQQEVSLLTPLRCDPMVSGGYDDRRAERVYRVGERILPTIPHRSTIGSSRASDERTGCSLLLLTDDFRRDRTLGSRLHSASSLRRGNLGGSSKPLVTTPVGLPPPLVIRQSDRSDVAHNTDPPAARITSSPMCRSEARISRMAQLRRSRPVHSLWGASKTSRWVREFPNLGRGPLKRDLPSDFGNDRSCWRPEDGAKYGIELVAVTLGHLVEVGWKPHASSCVAALMGEAGP